MKHRLIALVVGLGAVLCSTVVRAEDQKPIKALFICGGCCHDYKNQKEIIPKGISARANVEWTIAYDPDRTTHHLNPIYSNPDWYKGFDIIVHDECSADITDPATIARILEPHKNGLPAITLHCAMHCYRSAPFPKTTPWMEFTGMNTNHHGAQLPIAVSFTDPANEITKGMQNWTTINEELYHQESLMPTAKALANGTQETPKGKDSDVVIWTNDYHGTRVFSTTLGHNNETCGDARYLDLLTHGLLWAVNKFDAEHMTPAKQYLSPTAGGDSGALMPENLASGKHATASSVQSPDLSPAAAFDGDDRTRWCASDASMPQWLQVDLGKAEDVTGVRINWEMDDVAYKYKVDGSADGKEWKTLVDASHAEASEQNKIKKFDAKGVRYVRLNVLEGGSGAWASVFEFEVFGTKMVKGKSGPAVQAQSDERALKGMKAPAGFELSLFASPPQVDYPTCLTAAPTGEVFIGIDEAGSLGHQANAGRVVRAIDSTGSGKADKLNTFATMDHPRGLVWDDGKLWVLHPPFLTLYQDNGTGVAGPGKDICTGISTPSLVNARGADHTTNGIRMGIDGWIYIAMGDFGMLKATTSDGKPFQVHGGGVMRVRPDGTDLEVYCFGTRNIYDVAIDPFMNVFTRDNTNDGDNWNDRLAYDVPTGYYGYPSYFMHFPGEFIDCLADYGGGAPCGSIFLDEPNLPKGLFTVEWGNSQVDHHPLTPMGANFKAGMEKFIDLPRGTDIDADGSGHLFLSSWAGGGFAYGGPNVGFVARLSPQGSKPEAFPDLHKATPEQLLGYLASPSGVLRQATQREMIRRGDKSAFAAGLEKLAGSNALLQGRVAAIFTMPQLLGASGYAALAKLTTQDDVREFALRALADKKGDAAIPIAPFLEGLKDKNPRVRVAAAWGLNRLGRPEAIKSLMPLLADSDPVVIHVAMQSLIALHAVDDCMNAIDPANPLQAQGAVWVLQRIHEIPVAEGLMNKANALQDAKIRGMVYGGLCRLYHTEAEWDGQWWGTRPDTRGPYYKPVDWDGTTRIGAALAAAFSKEKGDAARALVYEVQRNGVDSADVSAAVAKAAETDPAAREIVVQTLDNRRILTPDQVSLLQRVAVSGQESPATRVKALRALQYGQGSPGAINAIVEALSDVIAAPQSDPQLHGVLDEFLRDTEHAGKISTFEKLAASKTAGKSELGYAVLINLANSRLIKPAPREAATKAIDSAWTKPESTIALLHAIGQTKAKQYAPRVELLKKDSNPQVAQAAVAASADLGGGSTALAGGKMIQDMQYEAVVAAAKKDRGDAKLGKELFARQGCIVCHTTSAEEPSKGPLLAGIAQRYSRDELCESIMKPSAKIAQGFETQWFKLKGNDTPVEGFVVKESGDQIEVRNITGASVTLKSGDIERRGKRDTSVMPEGLVVQLTPHDLASILAYLETLNAAK